MCFFNVSLPSLRLLEWKLSYLKRSACWWKGGLSSSPSTKWCTKSVCSQILKTKCEAEKRTYKIVINISFYSLPIPSKTPIKRNLNGRRFQQKMFQAVFFFPISKMTSITSLNTTASRPQTQCHGQYQNLSKLAGDKGLYCTAWPEMTSVRKPPNTRIYSTE